MIVCILSYLSSMNGRMMIMPSSRSMRISTILAAACLLVSSCRAFVHPTTRNNRLLPPPSSSLLLFASSSRKQPPKKRRFSQAAHNVVKPTRRKPATKKNPPQRKKQELWQSSKSIEELEATMTKRWGTEMDKWTADPNEYELFVDDPGDAEGGVFRAKPVLDPWQETTTQEAPLSDYNEDDVVMNRVRRNQERLQRKQQEFYDEDDEGYEPNDRYSQNEDIRIDHLIAPQPVGGRGTTKSQERERMRAQATFSMPMQSQNLKRKWFRIRQLTKIVRQRDGDDNSRYRCSTTTTDNQSTLLYSKQSVTLKLPWHLQKKGAIHISHWNQNRGPNLALPRKHCWRI